MQTVVFTLNGVRTTVTENGALPVLYALRENLNKKATRFGCGDAACGACTIIVDGKAMTSCDLPLHAIDDAVVETAEGLNTATPHPLVQAVLDLQAAQCGYCLPGILMAAKALLDQKPYPDRAEIIDALDANLCRCGAHVRILQAVEMARERLSP